MSTALLAASGAVLIYVLAWFVVSRVRDRNDVADIAWGPGFVVAVLAALAAGDGVSWRGGLVTVLVALWGGRLAWHIARRGRGRPEDARYRKWRQEWGESFVLRSLLQVFLLQGALLLVVALPALRVAAIPGPPLGWFDLAGLLLWMGGFACEAAADGQLRRFVADPANRGRLMTEGLWHYSRHPNYFGEVVQWWGIWLIALAVPGSAWTMLGPVTITLLILKVSGIPMLEERYRERPDFQRYAARTSVFVPWFPKRDKE